MGLPSASMSRVAGWFALEIGYALRATSLQTKFSVLGFQFSENNGQIAAGHAPRAYKTTFSVLGSQFSVLSSQRTTREIAASPNGTTLRAALLPIVGGNESLVDRKTRRRRPEVARSGCVLGAGWLASAESVRQDVAAFIVNHLLTGYPSPHISIFGNQQLTEIFPLDL
jgi:hypothetical protein